MMTYNNYKDLLTEIKSKVREAQVKTVMAENAQMLFLYWQMGNYILENQQAEGWGTKIVDKLSADLKKEFPQIKGFSARNLKYMRKFAEQYPLHQIEVLTQIEEQMKAAPPSQKNMIALLEKGSDRQIVQQGVAQLKEQTFLDSVIARVSWSHHIILMDKVADPGKRLWYMLFALEQGVGRNVLAIQIEGGLFERQVAAKKIN